MAVNLRFQINGSVKENFETLIRNAKRGFEEGYKVGQESGKVKPFYARFIENLPEAIMYGLGGTIISTGRLAVDLLSLPVEVLYTSVNLVVIGDKVSHAVEPLGNRLILILRDSVGVVASVSFLALPLLGLVRPDLSGACGQCIMNFTYAFEVQKKLKIDSSAKSEADPPKSLTGEPKKMD